MLFRVDDLLDERAEDFALREAMDMGMPYRDFLETIMPTCSGLFRYFGGLATQMGGSYRQSYEPGVRILVRREPLGVVGCITPFNFPLVLSCTTFAPALAAENIIVQRACGPISRELSMATETLKCVTNSRVCRNVL